MQWHCCTDVWPLHGRAVWVCYFLLHSSVDVGFCIQNFACLMIAAVLQTLLVQGMDPAPPAQGACPQPSRRSAGQSRIMRLRA